MYATALTCVLTRPIYSFACSEKASKTCSVENNKRRKISTGSRMERQRSAEIPDVEISCEGYELGAIEVSDDLTNHTKELNDSSIKLGRIMKSMLRNVVEKNPEQQHQLQITGMFIAGNKSISYRTLFTISSSSLFISRIKNFLPSIIKSNGICLCA